MSRVLLIEDDAAVIRMLHRMLVDAGYVAQDADNGKAGLAYYRQQPSDVVITDILTIVAEALASPPRTPTR